MASEELSPFLRSDGDNSLAKDNDVESPMFRRTSSRRCWCLVTIVVVTILTIAALFGAGILVGHFAISSQSSCTNANSSTGNITEEICADPPLLLISLDGFRAAYFRLNVTPNIQDLYMNGVKSEFMRSSFPTKTFPNHYSIVTGLYPEYHGIVANHFYDTDLKDKFDYNRRSSLQSKWWGGEPIWVTASLNHLHTASYFWPGSEAAIKGVRPDEYLNYDGSVPFSVRVETVMEWLYQPKEKRPKFITLYFNEPDSVGHEYGPDSSEIKLALTLVDGTIRFLMRELRKRNISDCVNIVIVSDHGMAAYNSSDFINIDEFISPELQKNISFPLGVISSPVISGDQLKEEVFEAFVNGTKVGPPFRVFPSDQMPLRLHAGQYNKQRYGAIYAVADVHGAFGLNSYNKAPLGNHGFDNIEKDMKAIFIGHGPYFKKNYVAEGFENIQVYSLLCDLLNIKAADNNGSYGALHHLLDPTFASKLDPPQSLPPALGNLDQCPFPQDEQLLRNRSLCPDCICRNDSCQVSDEDLLSANRYLFNSSTSTKEFHNLYNHPWGVPQGGSGEGACVLSQRDYVSLYSHTLDIPLWAGYTLDPQLVDGNVSAEYCCWRNDPRLPVSASTNCSTDEWLDNNNGSAYVPAPLLFPMGSSPNTTLSICVLSNVVYMDRSFWNGIWMLMMSRIRAWFETYNASMNVIIGVILDANGDGVRDSDSTYANKFMGVAIPTHFYVVVTRCGVRGVSLQQCKVKDMKVLGLVLQHPRQPGDYADDEKVLRYSLTSVRDIERATGVDFFPHLSAEDQNTLELTLLDDLWATE